MGIKPACEFDWVNGREVVDGKTAKPLDAEEILGVIRWSSEKYISRLRY
jgi:hypothetical protein